MLYTKSELKNAIFFEVATKSKPYLESTDKEINIWENHFHPRYSKNGELTILETYEKHSKYVPEFGEIISVTIGVVEDDLNVTVLSTDPGDEKSVLTEFAGILNKYVQLTAAGYNLTNYTIPYLVKKMIINKVALPFHLKLRGKKPWEINMIDVMKDYQGPVFESLKLEVLAHTLGVKYNDYDETKPTESCERYLKTVIECGLKMAL